MAHLQPQQPPANLEEAVTRWAQAIHERHEAQAVLDSLAAQQPPDVQAVLQAQAVVAQAEANVSYYSAFTLFFQQNPQ